MFKGLSLKQLKKILKVRTRLLSNSQLQRGTTKLLTYYTTNYKGQTKKLIPFYMTDILFTEL